MHNTYQFSSGQPFQLLPELARNYVVGVANEIGVDVNIVAITSLAAANTLLLDAECHITSNFHVRNSAFFLLGAPPSSGKSPCVDRFMRVLQELFEKHLLLSEEEASRRQSTVAVEMARQKALLKKAAKESDVSRRTQLTDEHALLEQSIKALKVPVSPLMGQMSLYSVVKELEKRDGIGTNIDPEGGLFAEANSVAKELLKPLLKAWSSEELSETTKNANFRVKQPVLTIAALWQDKLALSFLRNSKYYEVGLTARILPYISPQMQIARTGPIDQNIERCFAQLAERILVSAKSAREKGEALCFSLSTQAADWFSKFQQLADSLAMQGELLHEYPEIAGKLDVQAVKLAMILHALELTVESGNKISEDTMYKACQLALFFAEQHAQILGSANDRKMVAEGQKLIEILTTWHYNNPDQGFEVGVLKRPTGFSKAKCERILFWLQQKQAVSLFFINKVLPDGQSQVVEQWQPHIPILQALLNS